MIITPGTRFNHYEVISQLGAGGMGEVYLAEDPRLGRQVAIKLLPAEFARDSDRLRRFEQEARATSALNHPNILTVYDIGDYEGAPYIVAELLEGEELSELIKQGAIAPRKAVDYARQIAEGLAAAHAKGVVHRDMKPENLFITKDGRVKILDFGLAKLKPTQAPAVGTNAPTQKKITDPGAVLGTVGYMAPEQVRGLEADHRADIFSFGVILYEMLSGRRTFSGESAIEVMNAILKEDPPELMATNNRVPQGLERLIRRCLEKRPEHRFHSAHDLGYALEALSTSSSARLENVGAPSIRKPERMAWLVALLIGLLGFAWAYFTRQPIANDARVMKFSILPPPMSSFGQIAVSPDGRYLAFTAATVGNVQLWVRPLDSTEARALAGTQGASLPFWSPDSRFIAFSADGQLKKIEVTGGPVQTLCNGSHFGAAWSHNGVILFARLSFGLMRVSGTGGEPTLVTTVDSSRQEIALSDPTFLPDGRHFLYSIHSGNKETRGVYIGSLDGPLKHRLLDDITPIRYMAAVPGDTAGGAGWLVFKRDDALQARPFDARRLEFTGEPFLLSDKLGSDVIIPTYSTFSVSDNGVLVFDPSASRQRRQFRWVDRRGQLIRSLEAPAGSAGHWLSPDEKRFIDSRLDPRTSTNDLWLCDISGGIPQRFTTDPAHDQWPVWSPDGRSIVWASNRGGEFNLYQKAANLAGEDTLLLRSDSFKSPTGWSRDGRFIIYRQNAPKRFLINAVVDTEPNAPLTVWINWAAGVKK